MTATRKATLLRIGSAVVALPIYAFTIVTDMLQATPILICSLVVTLACLYEFYRIADRGEGERPFISWGMAAAVIINIVMYLFSFGKIYGYGRYLPSFDARVVMAFLAIFLSAVLTFQLFARPLKGATYSLGTTLLGLVYIVFSFAHIIPMKALANGVSYIIILNIVVMLNDSAAYFGGVLFGKHKTGFAASPNKSWEGYFTGLLFGVLGIVIANQFCLSFLGQELFGFIESVLVGTVLCILGDIGDLVESAFKRDGSIKDSGSIVPGHGGMWDVFDALIFTMPLFYYYLLIRGLH